MDTRESVGAASSLPPAPAPELAPAAAGSVVVGDAEVAESVLELAFVLVSEWGHPADFGKDACRLRQCRHRASGHLEAGEWAGVVNSLQGLSLVGELLSLSRKRKFDLPAGRYRLGSDLFFVPIYSDDGYDVARFILASVGQDVAPRCWPVLAPFDIVAVIHQCGLSRRNLVGVLSELVRVYCDAVRLCGKVIGPDGNPISVQSKLVCTLCGLAGLLGDAIGALREHQAADASKNSDNSNDAGGIHVDSSPLVGGGQLDTEPSLSPTVVGDGAPASPGAPGSFRPGKSRAVPYGLVIHPDGDLSGPLADQVVRASDAGVVES